jgi:hypothetical protein
MGTRLKYFFPVMLRDLSLRSACDMVYRSDFEFRPGCYYRYQVSIDAVSERRDETSGLAHGAKLSPREMC